MNQIELFIQKPKQRRLSLRYPELPVNWKINAKANNGVFLMYGSNPYMKHTIGMWKNYFDALNLNKFRENYQLNKNRKTQIERNAYLKSKSLFPNT